MKWLGKMFKKKKKITFNEKGKYKLLIIDEDAELLHENLGINDVRVKELLDICVDAYEKSNAMHSALEKVVSECVHTNEVVMASLMLQKIVDRSNSSDRLHNMLKNLFGRG